ncbi:hypothetical protein J1614_000625 [Plenodomus biglobosus]|nr:hypothetical protein J1614_000625 [Plenodomus biglobosus]
MKFQLVALAAATVGLTMASVIPPQVLHARQEDLGNGAQVTRPRAGEQGQSGAPGIKAPPGEQQRHQASEMKDSDDEAGQDQDLQIQGPVDEPGETPIEESDQVQQRRQASGNQDLGVDPVQGPGSLIDLPIDGSGQIGKTPGAGGQ